MSTDGDPAQGDRWSRWVLAGRVGADAERRSRAEQFLGPIRDRVLDAAAIEPGDRVLDVGAGDGLLGFAALDRVGGTGRVVFSDISPALLDHCRNHAAALGTLDGCEFVRTGLPDLAAITDASVDAAVLRSVLIYVEDLTGSLAALHRVLRPGGRLSLFEPVNKVSQPERPGRLWSFDVTGLEPLAEKVRAQVRRVCPPEHPLLRFDERRLLDAVERAGFATASLEYTARIGLPSMFHQLDWEGFQTVVPNPTMPSYGQILRDALEPEELAVLGARLAEELKSGRSWTRMATCYLAARRA
jgi:ubiquinone/menaquinone biosynthesis C-methylase UbiE